MDADKKAESGKAGKRKAGDVMRETWKGEPRMLSGQGVKA